MTSPVRLERVENDLRITWSDGITRRYLPADLREHCPCATCREKRRAPQANAELLPVIAMEETRPCTVTGMRPVGNYAYNIQFNDGHDTGIFTFALLQTLGDLESDSEQMP